MILWISAASTKPFEIFGFGENLKKWIKVIYNQGKSCVTNNGFISETFILERSTRQGCPLSPIVFVLVLELLFITIRSDPNIHGIKIEKNEIKLTALADDATYFLRDKRSAEIVLQYIADFSRASGLQVNRTKSEILLLEFEQDLGEGGETFLGIPIVTEVKILGHYFGKNKIICDFHNFHSKLAKLDKITNMWKQRFLTIFLGKNSNTSFAQFAFCVQLSN